MASLPMSGGPWVLPPASVLDRSVMVQVELALLANMAMALLGLRAAGSGAEGFCPLMPMSSGADRARGEAALHSRRQGPC